MSTVKLRAVEPHQEVIPFPWEARTSLLICILSKRVAQLEADLERAHRALRRESHHIEEPRIHDGRNAVVRR